MKPVSITFLGTCSGGGPMISRACSATALTFESTSWLVDCAEGTQTQVLRAQGLRVGSFSRVFITHMHSDHVMGLVPLLRTAMFNPLPSKAPSQLRIQIYGPPGLRSFVRFILNMTGGTLIGQYAVHELLQKGESPSVDCSPESLHANEAPGMDIEAGEDGLWRDLMQHDEWSVDAGPLSHRIRSLGYVFREEASSSLHSGAYTSYRSVKNDPGRKIVILGDTCDSSAMIPIAMDASALVHESTNAFIPREIADKVRTLRYRGDRDSMRKKAIDRGHSTADMAGEFAKAIRARRLFLNHFSTIFSPGGQSPENPGKKVSKFKNSHTGARREATIVMDEIERQASEAWGLGTAVTTTDLLTVEIPQHEV